jgi:hypothetical protein
VSIRNRADRATQQRRWDKASFAALCDVANLQQGNWCQYSDSDQLWSFCKDWQGLAIRSNVTTTEPQTEHSIRLACSNFTKAWTKCSSSSLKRIEMVGFWTGGHRELRKAIIRERNEELQRLRSLQRSSIDTVEQDAIESEINQVRARFQVRLDDADKSLF